MEGQKRLDEATDAELMEALETLKALHEEFRLADRRDHAEAILMASRALVKVLRSRLMWGKNALEE